MTGHIPGLTQENRDGQPIHNKPFGDITLYWDPWSLIIPTRIRSTSKFTLRG